MAPSDLRLKNNISQANIRVCEDLVRSLSLNRFTWNAGINEGDTNQLGFIAQDVENFLPKSVVQGNMFGIHDCKLLDPSQIYFAMYGALQRSFQLIDNLEAKNIALSARITALENAANV